MIVDKSLSRGLADGVLQEFRQIRTRFLQRFGDACCGVPHRRAAVRTKAEALKCLGEELSLTQMIVNHHRWRWVTFNIFLPLILENDAGQDNRLVHYPIIRVQCANQKPVDIDGGTCTLLSVQEHAFERLFQRLNVMTAAQVKEEVHDALCLSLLLCPAAFKLGLKQIVLPTRSGAFLCSVDEEKQGLIAKTWISCETIRQRLFDVHAAMRAVYESVGGAPAMAERLGSVSIHDNPMQMDLPEDLLKSLRRFHWLREPYSARYDPEGEIWMHARRQARGCAGQGHSLGA
jgi:hypothetical protein